jgi:N4-gp56 family major capsid protein
MLFSKTHPLRCKSYVFILKGIFMAITTTSLLPAPIQQSFDYKLLSVPTPQFIHRIPAMKRTMPAKGGTVLRMRRYNPLNPALVPLGNTGMYPPAQTASGVDIDAKLDTYGTFVIVNELVTLTNQDPVLNEIAIRLGVSLRQTEDQLIRDMLAATAGFINCTGGANGDTPSDIAREDVDIIVRTLKGNNAKTILDSIEGQNKFGTAPVRAAYFALGHTDLIGQLENVDGFIHQTNYPAPMNILEPEWGSVGNLRFLLSSVGSTVPTSSMGGADVYNVFCVGMEAFAYVDQNNYNSQFIYRPPMFDGPLALNSTMGYKFRTAVRITNDAWILNMRCTLA